MTTAEEAHDVSTCDGSRPLTRVVLVDDHEMVAAGLAAVLGDEPDIDIVGVAASLAEALRLVELTRPDVVVMDYRLPDGDGAEGTRRLRDLVPELQVIILTAATEDQVLADALSAGSSGFVAKGGSVEHLALAVRAAANGDAVFPAEAMGRLARFGRAEPAAGWNLTAREREVLQALAEGQSTGAIARSLTLSEHTVRNHVRNVLQKLDAHTKLEAVVIAARAGLIDLGGR